MELTPELITIIASSVTAIVGGFTTYFGMRYKRGKNQVQELINANTDFRNEVRADLKEAKEDLARALTKIEVLQDRVKTLEREGYDKDTTIRNQAIRITELESIVSKLSRQ
jgi:predicted phage gp36 major capsid-like protein